MASETNPAAPERAAGQTERVPAGAGLRYFVVTDGRRGIENQALGVAEALARLEPGAITVFDAPRPSRLHAFSEWIAKVTGRPIMAAPSKDPELTNTRRSPDVVIACGRAGIIAAANLRVTFGARPFLVYIQDPRHSHDLFDLIVAPEHDEMAGPNVLTTIGSPNRVSLARLEDDAALFASALDELPKPRAAVLIGGVSKRHRLNRARAAEMVDDLERLADQGAGLMITTSRRTPDHMVAELYHRFEDRPGVRFWDGESNRGPNPYFAFLAAADTVLVTKDSTNMITEAATAGKPVQLLDVDGRDGKLSLLYEQLIRRGNARRFKGELEVWPVEPLTETDRLADEVLERLRARRSPQAAR